MALIFDMEKYEKEIGNEWKKWNELIDIKVELLHKKEELLSLDELSENERKRLKEIELIDQYGLYSFWLDNKKYGHNEGLHFDDAQILSDSSLSNEIKNMWKAIQKFEHEEIETKLHNLIEQNDYILNYLSTSKFANEQAKKKGSSRVEQTYLSQSLEKLSELLLDKFEFADHPILSNHSEERNKKKEISFYHNAGNDDTGETDLINIMMLNSGEKVLKQFSEDDLREMRSVDLVDIEKYPELFEMQQMIDAIDKILIDKEKFIHKHNEMITKQLELALHNWKNGIYRVDMSELLSNPYKRDEVALNANTKGLIDDESLSEQFEIVMNYYSISSSANKQFNRLKKIRNAIKSELRTVYDQLRKPLRVKSTISNSANTSAINNQIVQNFLFNNPKHIEQLIKWHKNENKEYISLYTDLMNKYEYSAGEGLHNFLKDFRELVNTTKFNEIEVDILLIMLEEHSGLTAKDKGKLVNNPYECARDFINDKYSLNIDNRYIKKQIKKISKKVAHTYLDQIDNSPVVICSCCEEGKKLNDRNFATDSRMKSKYKSICRECEAKKAKKYRNN